MYKQNRGRSNQFWGDYLLSLSGKQGPLCVPPVIGGVPVQAPLYYLWLPGLVASPCAACQYQPGVVAHPCNFATGGLVCWTVGGRGPLVVLDHVEPASALSAASAWAPRGSPWRPGGLESRAPGQALQGAAQTGRVVQ